MSRVVTPSTQTAQLPPATPVAPAPAPIAAVLFDMDGVLIDARDWHYEALNAALGHFGLAIGRDEHLWRYDGLPTRRKLEMLSDTRGLPRKLHSFINALKQDYTAALTHQRCRPRFHHEFALAQLKRDGLAIAVCSNSIRRTVELMMELSRLRPYLDLMVSNEDVAAPKPAPDCYLAAMAALGRRPEQCLIVEDNAHGIAAARAAGAHLMTVSEVGEVTYDRIRVAMAKAEEGA